MIDRQLIESAISIRTEFLRLNSELDKYMIDVRKLAVFLKNKLEDLTRYNEEVIKKPKVGTTVQGVTEELVRRMEEIEIEELKIKRQIESINTRLEVLQNDEKVLYETIKKRHPTLTDEMITKEIRRHLPK